MLDVLVRGLFGGADFFDGLGEVKGFVGEEFVDAAEGFDVVLLKAAALEADVVDAAQDGGVAIGDEEGRDVLHDLGAAADDRVRADPFIWPGA